MTLAATLRTLTMLISPAEPKILRDLGQSSAVTEKYGADFLFASPVFGSVGVQRKEIRDFVASSFDGRLDKELAQMKALGLGVVLLEGEARWTGDGLLMNVRQKWTRAMHQGRIWSIQNGGVWVDAVEDVAATIEWLGLFQRWVAKERHGRKNRGGPDAQDSFGKRGNVDWSIHLLQGFEGIGYETAKAMVDAFHGPPLQWRVTEKELLAVKGVGKVRARKLMEALADGSTGT